MHTIVMNQGMLVSGIILAASFILIFTETLHGFHRVKVAMAGAAVMLVVGQSYGFYSPEAAFEAVDWNVVFLLGAMMAVVSIMINTGGFEVLAGNIGKIAKGRQYLLLALLGTAVTVISLLLDNVTTVVIFGPLIVLICQKMRGQCYSIFDGSSFTLRYRRCSDTCWRSTKFNDWFCIRHSIYALRL